MRIRTRALRQIGVLALFWGPAAFAVSAAAPPAASATDFVVGPSQLQGALDSAKAGDRLFLNPGIYSSSINVRRGGQLNAPITITRATSSTPVLTGRWQIQAPYVTVSRLIFDGSAQGDYPIWVRDGSAAGVYGSHFLLDHCEIRNARLSGIFVGETGPAMPVRGVVIRGCYFHGNGSSSSYDHGIYIKSGSSHLIERNLIVGSSSSGIENYPHAEGVTIRGNEIRENGSGIVIEHDSGDQLPLVNNTLVDGNYLKSNRGMGISLHYADDLSVPPGITNTVQNNWASGNVGGQYGRDGALGASDNTRGATWSGNVYGDPPGGVLVPLSAVGPDAGVARDESSPPPPRRPSERCRVRSGSARMSPRGVVRLRLACPVATKGNLRLQIAPKRKRRTRTLGRKSFSVPAGNSTLKLKLNKRGRRAVRHRKRVRARATLTQAGASSTTRSFHPLTVKSPRKRARSR